MNDRGHLTRLIVTNLWSEETSRGVICLEMYVSPGAEYHLLFLVLTPMWMKWRRNRLRVGKSIAQGV